MYISPDQLCSQPVCCTMGTRPFCCGVKQLGCGISYTFITHPHQTLRSNMRELYCHSPLFGPHGMLQGDHYLCLCYWYWLQCVFILFCLIIPFFKCTPYCILNSVICICVMLPVLCCPVYYNFITWLSVLNAFLTLVLLK